MGLEFQLDEPLYLGQGGTSTQVPGLYDVSIDGHPYMIDTTFEFGRRDSFRYSSIPAQRSATDITNIPGENTINPQGLWRREQDDWSLGSGQRFLDRDGSVSTRFHHSQGIDPFTNKWYISLLKDTTKVVASTDTSLQVLTVAGYIYYLTSTAVYYASTVAGLASPSTVAGLSGVTPVTMCTDGYNIFIAAGANGVYLTTAGSSSNATQIVNVASQNVYFVSYLTTSNILLVANGPALYPIQYSGSQITSWPTALITQPDSTWLWNCACAGYGWIYIGGYSGGTASSSMFGCVYKTQMEPDGTALSAPTLSAPLPPGEIPYALYSYVNYVCLGTNQGFRFCQTLGPNDPGGSSGDLKVGPIIPNLQEPVTAPVQCFVGQNRFVYFGWSAYSNSSVNADETCTGLGIADISQFTGDQTPAYASSYMVAGTTDPVTSIAWWAGAPIFVVQGKGVYTLASTYVTSGFVQSGYIGFGIPDQKILIAYSVDTTDSESTIGASINQDDEATYPLGTSANVEQNLLSLPTIYGELFETTLTLYSGNSNTTTPTVRRATLQAFPAITAGDNFVVALRFYDQVTTRDSSLRTLNVQQEYGFLRALRQNQTVVNYQDGKTIYSVVVDDIDMVWYQRSKLPTGGFNGICIVTLKSATSGLIT